LHIPEARTPVGEIAVDFGKLPAVKADKTQVRQHRFRTLAAPAEHRFCIRQE
jgi:hypothetical protein